MTMRSTNMRSEAQLIELARIATHRADGVCGRHARWSMPRQRHEDPAGRMSRRSEFMRATNSICHCEHDQRRLS